MRIAEISTTDLFNAGRWRVEIFTDDNSHNMVSKWPSVRIGEIVEESNAAIAPQEHEDDELYFVGLENVESITGDVVNLKKRAKGEIKSRSKIFGKNYVLYGRLRPYLRKVFCADSVCDSGICSTEFIVLKPIKEKILPQVLRAILASEAIAKQLSRLQIGAALPRVSASDFFNVRIPLPPIKVQEKMAEKLGTLKTERLRLKVRLSENPVEIDQLVTDFALA